MSVEAREEYLIKLQASPIGLYRDLSLLARTLTMIAYARDEKVQAVIGTSSTCAVRPGIPPPDLPPLGDLDPLGSMEECDVVIVGSGAGGAMAATRLAEAGLEVVVLESGQHLDRTSYPTDPLEALPLLYRDGGLTVADGRPALPIPVGKAVGGTTVINSGTCFRAPDDVLGRWRDEEGIPWATSLGDHFADVERELHVRQVPLEDIGRNGQLCAEGARAIGASGAPISRNAGHCVQCSSCPLGCRLDAKKAMHVSYLPRAVAAGARIRAGVEVQRVLVEDGRAVGVKGYVARSPRPGDTDRRSFPRRPFEIRARHAVIAAGGALGTPELLLRSGMGGRGAGGSHLGRNLRVHPAAWIGALYPEEVRGWEGIMQSYYVDEWHDKGLILEATFTPLSFGAQWLPGVGQEHQRRLLRFDHVGSIGVHLSDHSSKGRVRLAPDGTPRLGYRLTREEARTIQYGIARAAEIHFAAGALEVYPQVGPVEKITREELPVFEAREFKPGALRLEAFHPMGTARMGGDPSATVTAPDGAVRGVEGLYVADASLLPDSIGVNPMLTIMAFASQVANGIAEQAAARRGASASRRAAQFAPEAGAPAA
jgi:choline dehydrogenase-like flavoprotein